MEMVTPSFLGTLLLFSNVEAFVPSPRAVLTSLSHGARVRQATTATDAATLRMSLEDESTSRGSYLQKSSAAVGVSASLGLVTSSTSVLPARAEQESAWEQISLPVASVLYDIAFDANEPDHGIVVGAQGTFLEVRSLHA